MPATDNVVYLGDGTSASQANDEITHHLTDALPGAIALSGIDTGALLGCLSNNNESVELVLAEALRVLYKAHSSMSRGSCAAG